MEVFEQQQQQSQPEPLKSAFEQHQQGKLGFQSDLSPDSDTESIDVSSTANLVQTDPDDEDVELEESICREFYDLAVSEAVREADSGHFGPEELGHGVLSRVDDEASLKKSDSKNTDGGPKWSVLVENGKSLGDEEDLNEFRDNEAGEEIMGHDVDDDEEKHELGNEDVDGFGVEGSEYEGRNEDEEEREYENGSENIGGDSSGPAQTDDKPRKFHYPLRPDAEDCPYYMRAGTCKFGSNCRFNHPLRRRNQAAKETMQKEENSDRPGQIECKYYLSSEGCKYGKACKYNHSRGRATVAPAPAVESNFLGLPIRVGEKSCPYYMRTGSCKYGLNCRFNHPDPTTVGGGDSPGAFSNGGSASLRGSLQKSASSWSSPRMTNGSASFAPMMYPPPQTIPPPNSEWNGYQAPVYPATSERSLPTPPAFAIKNHSSDTNLYTHHQQQMMIGDFPERPGQLECTYFMKTGDCKYRSACKFHHPKSRLPKSSPSVLSDRGLPLRPDQNVCTHYSRYGICKYGPACKYDHPVNYSNASSAAGYGSDGARMAGSGYGNGREPLTQQPV